MRTRYGALIVAGIFFGSTGTAQALGPHGISTMAVGSARLLCGALLLWSFTRFMPRTHQKMDKRDLWLSALGMALYQLTFFGAVKSTGVALSLIHISEPTRRTPISPPQPWQILFHAEKPVVQVCRLSSGEVGSGNPNHCDGLASMPQ